MKNILVVGSIYNDDAQVKRRAAFPVKTVDTTAAGNFFIGALAYYV